MCHLQLLSNIFVSLELIFGHRAKLASLHEKFLMLYALFQLLKDSLDYEFKFSGIHLTDYELETTLLKGNLGKVDIHLNSVTIKDVALDLKQGQSDNSIDAVEAVENLSKPRELKSPKLKHEAEISPAEEGINDMSKIIQNIINSVSITVENVNINLGLISIHVDKIELKSSEIPSKLYIQENLLVNLIKYFYISGIYLQFNGIKMLKVGHGWVRLMFLQSLEESVHQAVELANDPQKMMQSFIVGESPSDSKNTLPSISGGLKDSILDANMELMISIDECVGISNVKLILELLVEIGSLSPTKPKSENGQQSPKIQVELGKMKLSLLPFKVVPDYEQLFGSYDLPNESLHLQFSEITLANSHDNGIFTLLLSCDSIVMKESGLQLLSLTGQFEPALSFRVVKLRNNLHSKMYLNLKAVKIDAIFNEILEYKSKYIGDLNQVTKTKPAEKPPHSYLELHIEDIDFNMHFNGENDTKSIRIIAHSGFSVLGDSTDSPTLQLSECSLFTNTPDPEKLLTSSKIKFRISTNPKDSDNDQYCDERFISKRHEIARKSNESDQRSSTSWSDSEDISPALNAERVDDISILCIRYMVSLRVSNFKIEATNHHLEYLKDVSKYIETATLGMSLDTQQPLIKFQLFIEFGSIFGNSILIPHHILLNFKSLYLDLFINSLDDFRNLTHMEVSLKEFDVKILDKELNRDPLLRIQPRLGGNFKVRLY